MDCSLSGSSIHGIYQARMLEWIAISSSRGSFRPRNRTRVSRIADRRFTVWATSEAIYYTKLYLHYIVSTLNTGNELMLKAEGSGREMISHCTINAWSMASSAKDFIFQSIMKTLGTKNQEETT